MVSYDLLMCPVGFCYIDQRFSNMLLHLCAKDEFSTDPEMSLSFSFSRISRTEGQHFVASVAEKNASVWTLG